ncbi:MAG: EAL domain-containing protein, partial [Tateyamaria sp.]
YKKRFEVHYQPLVDIRTQTVCSFEALLRLPNGDAGYIPPSEFIAVAESSHLIADLGTFVLHKACEGAQSCVASGQPRRTVSVNVSPAQIWHGDLKQVIDSALNASGLSPDLLCLELTESVFVADSIERLNGILCRLHQRGIRLALDDFGTGYSSLGYLTRLPFDILKIDRMFVSKAHASAEKRKMLRGVVSLAKGLDLKVTAEGVETAEELNLVRDLGCDTIQGWYFSKALPNAQALVNAERIDTQRSMTIPDTPKNLYKGGSLS